MKKLNKTPRPVTLIGIYTKNGNRFVICNAITGAVIDNAKGYGFKNERTAIRYAIPKGWQPVSSEIMPPTNSTPNAPEGNNPLF